MIIADWVIIGLIVLCCLLGLLVGFGRGLRFFTRGFFGAIICIIVCYFIGGLVYKIGFVQNLLNKFIDVLTGKNTFCDILIAIHIEMIVYYLVLFIVVEILRVIIVKIICSISEIDNIVMKIINRIFGVVLFAAVFTMIIMVTFQIIYWIGGTTAEGFLALLEGSKFKLDILFKDNPLITIIQVLIYKIEYVVPA